MEKICWRVYLSDLREGSRHEEVWELFFAHRREGPEWSERHCWGLFRPFTTVQTSPAGRTSLGQVGHIRKCVFVIRADMGIRGKAMSLPCRLFSLSRAGRLSKLGEDKQCCVACQGPVCLFLRLSLHIHSKSAIPQWLLSSFAFALFNSAFILLTKPCKNLNLQEDILNYEVFMGNISAISMRGGRTTLKLTDRQTVKDIKIARQESKFTQADTEGEFLC